MTHDVGYSLVQLNAVVCSNRQEVSFEEVQVIRSPEQKSMSVSDRSSVFSSLGFKVPMSGIVPLNLVLNADRTSILGLSWKSELGSDPVRLGLSPMYNVRSPDVPLGNDMDVKLELDTSMYRPMYGAVPRVGKARLPVRPVLEALNMTLACNDERNVEGTVPVMLLSLKFTM